MHRATSPCGDIKEDVNSQLLRLAVKMHWEQQTRKDVRHNASTEKTFVQKFELRRLLITNIHRDAQRAYHFDRKELN